MQVRFRATRRNSLPIAMLDVATRPEHDQRRQEIHRRVDCARDERHGPRDEDDCDLGAEEDDVDDRVEVDGPPDARPRFFLAIGLFLESKSSFVSTLLYNVVRTASM